MHSGPTGNFAPNLTVVRAGPRADRNWVFCDHYTPHAVGAYLLSGFLAHTLAEQAPNLIRFAGGDDVAVGLWLSPMRVWRRHEYARFSTPLLSGAQSPGRCKEWQDVISGLTFDDIRRKHDKFDGSNGRWHCINAEPSCVSPDDYGYNFRRPPSSALYRLRLSPACQRYYS